MSGKPAARLGDPTSCPKKGHGTNPIITGSPDVFIDGLPVARQGDATDCGSTLSDSLISNVMINGKPVATLGSLGDHGNAIIAGSGSVVIGSTHSPASFIPPLLLDAASAVQTSITSTTPSALQQPVPTKARALQEEPGDVAPYGLEEEEEEEELTARQAITLRIGVFFDGTGNNAGNSAVGAQCRAADIGLGELEAQALVQRCQAHHIDPDSSYGNDFSNIWRLYELYRDEPVPKDSSTPSIFRIYVTGAGTTTGEKDTRFPGQALGRGATGVLAKVEEGFALISQALENFQQANPNSLLDSLELDIFGFSRGAAAARHFANQVMQRGQGPLGALNRQGKLATSSQFDWDQNVVINFIGLFDTVAAIGGWGSWIDPSDAMAGGIDLHLAPDAAHQVVHLVARDEYRRNFALNQVSSAHREIILPGAHSDLGGGYLNKSVERLYLARPRRSWVSHDTDPLRTVAYQKAEEDSALARQAGLLDLNDRAARLETDVWEHSPPVSQSRTDAMKFVMAAPYLERTVYGHLSRIYLRVMHALAIEAGVMLDVIDEYDPKLSLPIELGPIKDKLLEWAKKGSGLLDEEEEQLLRQRYIHLSSNWNAVVGHGGGKWDLVFINAPAENGRTHHADMLRAKR